MTFINLTYDAELFIVQINGKAPVHGVMGAVPVNAGDVLRITTTYKRNWFVNGKPIGLQDEIDDAMYQNVYTVIPDTIKETAPVSIEIIKDKELNGDVFPYSVADASISCPAGWHFFESPAEVVRVSKKTFTEKEILWDLGEFIRGLELEDYIFKTLPRSRDYFDRTSLCGVVKEDDKYCFVHQGEYTLDGEPSDTYERFYFDSLKELSDSVKEMLLNITE